MLDPWLSMVLAIPSPTPTPPSDSAALSGATLLSGLIGALMGGAAVFVAAYFGARWAYANQLKLRDLDRETRLRASLRVHVGFEGTFTIQNSSDEEVTLTVRQRRLFVDMHDRPANNPNEGREVYRMIHAGEAENLSRSIESGAVKVNDTMLASQEFMEVPECEMFGFVAEQINDVLIGTAIDLRSRSLSTRFRRLYVHRFTMGGPEGPHPQARWHSIYSSSLDHTA
jgi:hypothetical protein